MIPWRAYLLMCRTIPQWTGTLWTCTHGEMISSDLHRAEIPSDGCCDPNMGQGQIRGFALEKRRMFHERNIGRALPMGVVPFPPGCWPWKSHDVTHDTYDTHPTLWRFWEVVMCQSGMCGMFLRPKKAKRFSPGGQRCLKRG
jgi:hypothetical protein